MVSLSWLVAGGLVVAYSVYYYQCYQRNLVAAKQSGIPYVVLPIYHFNRFWLVTHKLWLPFLEKLPKSWTHPWIDFLDPEWPWLEKYAPFKAMKTDTFMLCSPGRNTIFVADADAISQITTRRNDFPKPIEIYRSVDLYGKNVVSTEGSIWRQHRKITSPPFTEKNNVLVWQESIHQGQSMMTAWLGNEGETNKSIPDVAAATMRLSLHVISRAGFGVRLLWPHEEVKEKGLAAPLVNGHTLSFKDALSGLLENIIPVMLLPRWFLSRSPFKSVQEGYSAYKNWGQYMQEMYVEKKAEVKSGEVREGLDLMGALIKGAGITAESLSAQDTEKGQGTKQLLTDAEILGNAFVFILAGHETAANVIHFSILGLAMNWSAQARLQRDLDEIFGDKPVSGWDYDRDVPKLFGSMAGAVMNETLRCVPPVIGIPKCVPKGAAAQPLTINGRRVIVPSDCGVTLNAAATHRNPKYWPTMCPTSASDAEIEADLDAFKPERWLLDSKTYMHDNAVSQHGDHEGSDNEEIGGPSASDTSTTLFKPARGAYIPFSEGYRACLGRRFAQVEVLAVLAVIFREYSVELCVDEFASEDELAAMEGKLRREVWTKAKDKAQGLLKYGMMTIITIQMRKGKVPVRFIKRGKERFKFDA